MNKLLIKGLGRKAGEKFLPKATEVFSRFGNDLFRTVKPDFSDAAGMVNTVVRYGPDLIWPMMMLGNLPADTSLPDKLKVYLQDLGLNLLGSVGGQYGGAKLGGLAVKGGAPQAVATGLQTLGDLGAGMAQVQIPRPTFNKVLTDAGLEEQEVREAQIRQEEQEKVEQILNALVAGGGIGVSSQMRKPIV
tara:strand:- start:2503 stop:3072 length:570 start_codon:yes stop_codon:yes gene_type:complete